MSVSIDYPSFMRAAGEGGDIFLSFMAALSAETARLKEAARSELAAYRAVRSTEAKIDLDALAESVKNKIDDMRKALQ